MFPYSMQVLKCMTFVIFASIISTAGTLYFFNLYVINFQAECFFLIAHSPPHPHPHPREFFVSVFSNDLLIASNAMAVYLPQLYLVDVLPSFLSLHLLFVGCKGSSVEN